MSPSTYNNFTQDMIEEEPLDHHQTFKCIKKKCLSCLIRSFLQLKVKVVAEDEWFFLLLRNDPVTQNKIFCHFTMKKLLSVLPPDHHDHH